MFLRNKKFYLMFALLTLVFALAACGTKDDKEDGAAEPESEKNDIADVKENPIVTITMDNDEKIVIELEPAVAPNTVANFISLVEQGFYDGLIFHRVIPGFMIQGGDPEGTGVGGPDYGIKGEFAANGFDNNLKHERGVISMARAQDPDSAGSQFFIMVEDAPHLDEQYAAFGKVIEGIEVADAIVAVERDAADKPLEDQKIKKVEVDTKGVDYPEPEVIK
ncbi:peptidylprolyl isomerase [Metasolibacillus sp.]|uniref:peptidylprolyl isomerase n=1 Tax=Metasolibacillus sp. TaxID=2703680 RepID=UPI0025D1EBF0|nr:peptidylprolyl isomerase [Metasolibacillus sp.]MCT6924407.1 peptidylprolyl isomerase [Metasolibacillus sp.]MCT6940506.1 peptidylprolyl isomerase [Metasolibacillus sp.]